jgi:tetratricopeptide (TPR) repeat protein
MKSLSCFPTVLLLVLGGCQVRTNQEDFRAELESINLRRGAIALCGPEETRFGKVEFNISCSEKVRADFNLATALLHSFEYQDAEKVFAKVIDEDPDCLMAYWGVAMSNFHPLWARPTDEELEKGSKTIALARSLNHEPGRESDYLEAVAALYDDWQKLDHQARMIKFEKATEKMYLKYPSDKEAAIFYALALRAASDPADKSFAKQRKAGDILNGLFPGEPDHPGIAHYLIHTYDYPELAELALPAARKYASIAAASAHALHMPSHIFTRLGLWDESIQSNINSMAAAKCYAENSGMHGHWDEEIHGLDYLVYAYLQQGRDDQALIQREYLRSMEEVFPINFKEAYAFASVPARCALERKQWMEAANLQLEPRDFPWQDYLWERSNISFARILGAVHLKRLNAAKPELGVLEENFRKLKERGRDYEANQVQIQIRASEAWIHFREGRKEEAIRLMTAAADMEDATDKHPVTPGEVIPARELLGDLLMEAGEFPRALAAYEADLKRHQGRFNGLYGAGLAAKNSGDRPTARRYFQQLVAMARPSGQKRPELLKAESFLKQNL